MADAPKFNPRNPAVKRIMQEMKEIKQDTSGDIIAEALEGGIYHGRILLPAEYPFKPPSFMMLSPNGRFETGVKICLSISSHHPEHWQPSWSVRTALTALIAFMPSPGAGALGALDFPREERRKLAARSRLEAPRFGSAERQRVIDEMHARMLAIAAEKDAERAAAAGAGSSSQGPSPSADAPGEEPARFGMEELAAAQPEQASSTAQAGPQGRGEEAGRDDSGAAEEAGTPADSLAAGAAAAAAASAPAEATSPAPAPSPPPPAATTDAPLQAPPAPTPAPAPSAPVTAPAAATSAARATASAPAVAAAQAVYRQAAPTAPRMAAAAVGAPGPTSTDHMLTALMWALYVGIGAILLRKVMGAMGVDLRDLLAD
ncbi:hypothetical protein GPECTOR_64g137 [Gonium pectorale]|uniref:UBC core domain-containing protein n=1 Tax=Gonium pectorale TaxID=33097 RepID=A0A150G4D8_GONPE|nr:hypothetical protein GPECTOR_64g137 [Gonium pectorale]|eukprot:KXZ44643.1 hypothetical protein GPECTOR_64g137 [Gonium pectorale]